MLLQYDKQKKHFKGNFTIKNNFVLPSINNDKNDGFPSIGYAFTLRNYNCG